MEARAEEFSCSRRGKGGRVIPPETLPRAEPEAGPFHQQLEVAKRDTVRIWSVLVHGNDAGRSENSHQFEQT